MEQTLFSATNVETKRWLLQAHRIKLQDYIMQGIITPDRYMHDQKEYDIQTKNPDFLILSKGYLAPLDETQVLIELILTEEEQASLIIYNDVFFCGKPLPVSRIKKVYCQDKEIQKWILTNLESNQKGFMPVWLFDYFKKGKAFLFETISLELSFSPAPLAEYSKELRKFDKMMGMFTFMKNASMYYCHQTGIFSNYSDNYFALLSKLNPLIEAVDTNFLDTIKASKPFFELIYSEQPMSEEFIRTLIESLEDEHIKALFAEVLENPNATLRVLQQLDSIYFYMCLVYYFKNKNSDKKDSFKLDIQKYVPVDKIEYALAFLGIYLGYANLRSYEKIVFNDELFQKLAGNPIPMKFKLDSELDFFTIETLYTYAFAKDKEQRAFDYLDYPEKKIEPLPKSEEFNTWYDIESQKEYFDVLYFKIKKKSSLEVIARKVNNYGDEIVFGRDYLASFIAKHYKKLMLYSKEGKPTEPFCTSAQLLEALKDEDTTLKHDELFKVFELDKK